jgi:hypothetical protein
MWGSPLPGRRLTAPCRYQKKQVTTRSWIRARQGERHLRIVLAEYQAYYNMTRLRQGGAHRVPDDHMKVAAPL